MNYNFFGDKMNKLYMGLDIGSVITKGIIIDKYDNIIASACYYTEGNPIMATKRLIKELGKEIDRQNSEVVAIGATGSARKLIGTLLGAVTIKNEITAHAMGTVRLYPEVKTIFEIGGEEAKITLVNNGIVTDYAINTLCTAGTGLFIDSIAKRLNVDIDEISRMAISSNNKINIASRCTIFAETDLIHKIQLGYKKEDVLAGMCHMIASNYINNVAKGKKIQSPVVFNGGVSKNIAIVKELEAIIGEKIIVNKNSHLMGAFGVAIMARDSKKENVFDFEIDNYKLETRLNNCSGCDNNCEIIEIYKNDQLIDRWGNRCEQVKILKNV